MIANTYAALKENRDKERARLEGVSPEPAATLGVLRTPNVARYSQEALYQEGTMIWTRIATSIIVTVADALGYETFINLLDEYQRPANMRLAKELLDEHDFPVDPSSAFALLLLWSQGCLFNDYRANRRSIKSSVPGAMSEAADWCPQVQAMKELGEADRLGELQTWCEAYDNLIMQAVNPNGYFTYLDCIGKEGGRYCVTYIKDEADPPGANYYEKVKNLQEARLEQKDTLLPRPWRTWPFLMPRAYEQLEVAPAVRAKAGTFIKARIAMDNLIIGAHALGWEKLLDLIFTEHTKGFANCSTDLRSYFGIVGDDIVNAGLALASSLYMMGYDGHSLIQFDDEGAEGVATRCKLVDTAKNLGMADEIEDLSLWCDYHHNHVIHAINPEFQVTHTHCLGRGDKYCRFCLK